VLCPYIGQMFCLQREFVERELSKRSIKVVDNYQGEENDILLISLVRSNSEKRLDS
jgi:superfamily I DNA and/or RNA helicase